SSPLRERSPGPRGACYGPPSFFPRSSAVAKVFVKDVQAGERVESIFNVGKKSLPTSKSGKPYLALVLFDKTGEIDARVWNNAANIEKTFEVGDLVSIVAATVVHQGHPQLKL